MPHAVATNDQRLFLVLPGSPGSLGALGERVSVAVRSSEILYGLDTQTVWVDPRAPQADVEAVAARIRNGGVGLVVALGDGPASRALAEIVPRFPETRFAFLDASLSALPLKGVRNAAAIRFAEEDVLDLAGYLSGLMPTLDKSKPRVDQISVVAGEPTRDTARQIAAIRRGMRAARPGVKVRVDYSHELHKLTACERLANRQIDAGSDVVFAVAGRCGLGASEVARIRGVWSVGASEDGIRQRPHILAYTEKDWMHATLHAIKKLAYGMLPMGRDTVLGLEDDYAVILEYSDRVVPGPIGSLVVSHCSKIAATKHRDVDY